MDALQVRRMHARYRLPTSLLHERARLDRIFEEVVDSRLAEAVTGSSLADDEEVCIRSLDVTVRLRAGSTDRVAADAWTSRLVAAVDAAVAGRRDDVARYPSRTHAVVEMAAGAVRGDLGRWWAWRQLGLWTVGGEASPAAGIRDVVRALSDEPETIVPTIEALARLDLAGRFLAGAGDGVRALARAALRVADADSALLVPAEEETAAQSSLGLDAASAEAAFGGVGEALHRPLGRAAVDAARSTRDPGVRRALAVIVALAVDPAGVRAPTRGAALVGAIATALADAAGVRHTPRAQTTVADVHRAVTPAEHPIAAETGAVGMRTPHDAAPDPAGDRSRPAALAETEPPSARRTGHTGVGGLLFLLRVLGRLDVPGELAANEAFAARPVRSWLHRLAMTLADLDPADAAALAFAGLPPDAPPPSAGEPPLREPERSALAGIADRIVDDVESLVEHTGGGAGEGTAGLLAWICRRPAEIVADPGWIEARFELASVDLDLRRAGLDLDPGYLPWLGSVVRFRYG